MHGVISHLLYIDSTFFLLLLLFLHFILLFQVDVWRLHSDDRFVQKTERFLHVFGLNLETWDERARVNSQFGLLF